MSTRLNLLGLSAVALLSCDSVAYVNVEIPPKAANIKRFQVTGTASMQTEFAYDATFPSMEVIEFYKEKLDKNWRYCEWGPPTWSEFTQTESDGPVVIHQQLRMWLNEAEKESIGLAVRYYSEGGAQGKPSNTLQHIILTQNTVIDIQETITALALKCH